MIASHLFDDVLEVAVEAGKIARQYSLQTGLKASIKADDTLLSEADTTTESWIVGRLHNLFPNEPVIGEETIAQHDCDAMAKSMEDGCVWVIDPIDGTNNFLAGLPIWCVAIARLERGQPTLGIIYFPALDDEIYYNRDGCLYSCENASSNLGTGQKPARTWEAKSSLFMTTDSFHERFWLLYPHLPRISGCTVYNVLCVMLGKSIGAFTSAHLWDFAAPMAYASICGVEMINIADGRKIEKFTSDDFHLSAKNPKKAWRIKHDCLISRPPLTAEMHRSISSIAISTIANNSTISH